MTRKHCVGACVLALHPCSGEDLSRCELAVHRRDSDAAQACHLLLELGSAPGLPFVVQLMKEALCPLVYQAHPVRADLRDIAQGLETESFLYSACVCICSCNCNMLGMLAGCGVAKAGRYGTAGDVLIPVGSVSNLMCSSACLGKSLGKDGQLPHEQKVQRHRLADLRPLHLHCNFAAAVLLRQPCAIYLHNQGTSHDANTESHPQIAPQVGILRC